MAGKGKVVMTFVLLNAMNVDFCIFDSKQLLLNVKRTKVYIVILFSISSMHFTLFVMKTNYVIKFRRGSSTLRFQDFVFTYFKQERKCECNYRLLKLFREMNRAENHHLIFFVNLFQQQQWRRFCSKKNANIQR